VIDLRFGDLAAQFCDAASGIRPYLEDPMVTDIFINGTVSLFVERAGVAQSLANPFRQLSDIFSLIERVVAPLGKRIDASRPFLDGTLRDGSRFHIILPPLVHPGPAISIRKFGAPESLTLDAFANPLQKRVLEHWVQTRFNILICGATGAGKTTLLGQLLQRVSPQERVLVIEECPEIQARLPHLVRLTARPESPDSKGGVSLSDLVWNSLRMRPDRIVVGECRGRETLDFLQAMTTGHSGCMGTVHARGARDALSRLEVLVALSGVGMERSAVKQWISSAIGGVVFMQRTPLGSRRQIAEMVEVKGWEGEHFRLLPIGLETPLDSGNFAPFN
jgi:pilus assembly protein CpaF